MFLLYYWLANFFLHARWSWDLPTKVKLFGATWLRSLHIWIHINWWWRLLDNIRYFIILELQRDPSRLKRWNRSARHYETNLRDRSISLRCSILIPFALPNSFGVHLSLVLENDLKIVVQKNYLVQHIRSLHRDIMIIYDILIVLSLLLRLKKKIHFMKNQGRVQES